MQPGPWLKEEEGRGGAGQIPVNGVAGGEEKGARELEWTMAHLTDGLGEERDGRRGLVGEEQSTAAGVNIGGGVPSKERRG